MCSGRISRRRATDSSHDSRVCCARPAIKSKLILRNPASRKNLRRRENIRTTMHAPRGLQFAVVKRLHAQADAIESGRKPCPRFFGRDGFGIGFERDFGRRSRRHFARGLRIPSRRSSKSPMPAQRTQNSCKRGRLQQARCAAAQVHRVHGGVAQAGNFAPTRPSTISRQTAAAYG